MKTHENRRPRADLLGGLRGPRCLLAARHVCAAWHSFGASQVRRGVSALRLKDPLPIQDLLGKGQPRGSPDERQLRLSRGLQ